MTILCAQSGCKDQGTHCGHVVVMAPPGHEVHTFPSVAQNEAPFVLLELGFQTDRICLLCVTHSDKWLLEEQRLCEEEFSSVRATTRLYAPPLISNRMVTKIVASN